MPICQICGKELKVVNLNHLSKHDTTLEKYIAEYGDPNRSMIGTGRVVTSAKKIANKVKAPGELTVRQHRTVEDLFELEKTITVPRNFYWVDESNKELLDKALELVYAYKKVSIDTETTGLNPFEDRVTHIIISTYDPDYKYNLLIPLYHEDAQGNKMEGLLDTEYVVSKIKPILEDPEIKTVWYNLYFDAVMLKNSLGITVANICPPEYIPKLINGKMTYKEWDKTVDKWTGGWDGSIAARVLNENEPSHKLKDLYKKYVYDNETDEEIKGLNVETFEEQFGNIRFFRVPKKMATCYGAKDGYITRKMEEFQRPYIESVGRLDNILYTIEYPLVYPLVQMRLEGIRLDFDTVDKVGAEIEERRSGALQRVKDELGDINLNSPKQVSHALFEVQGLPDLQKGSTKSAVLEELAELGYDLASDLIEYKKMDKLKSSFIDPAENLVAPDGKVHCNFNQGGTRTGRFSSSNPNMQQIPARYGVIRTMFQSDPGDILIGGDFSQIEPRLTAHTCQDEHMVQAYIDELDLYSTLAARVFTLLAKRTTEYLNESRIDPEDPMHGMAPFKQQLYKDEFIYLDNGVAYYKTLAASDCIDGTLYRKVMKTLWLGMNYGMTEYGLAKRLRITEADALEILQMFYGAFPKLKKAMDECNKGCQKTGFVETKWGRKRRLPDIWADEKWIRRKVERQTFNAQIQGGAADLMKIAMLLVAYDPRLAELGFKMLLTIHDELIGGIKRSNAYEASKLMVQDMIDSASLIVPLKVDAELYINGEWNGDSIQLKKKADQWQLVSKGTLVDPADFGLI